MAAAGIIRPPSLLLLRNESVGKIGLAAKHRQIRHYCRGEGEGEGGRGREGEAAMAAIKSAKTTKNTAEGKNGHRL